MSLARGQVSWLGAREPPIVQACALSAAQCRCGVRAPAGGIVFRISTVPQSLEFLLGEVTFCSVRCIRQFCLEAIETLDSLDQPGAERIIRDLHEIHSEITKLLAAVSSDDRVVYSEQATEPASLFLTRASTSVPCRCGTRVPAGDTVFGLLNVPPSLENMFRPGLFCSVTCIGVLCLESLEILDGIDTLKSQAMVTDLHELHRRVTEILAEILRE